MDATTVIDVSAVRTLGGDHDDAVVRALPPLGVRSLVAHPLTLEQLLLRDDGDDLSALADEDASAADAR